MKTIPDYLQFLSPLNIEAAGGDAEEGQKTPRFSMVAYTGGTMRIAGFPHPVVVDLEGLSVDRQDIPVRLDHNPRQGVGHTQRVAVENGQVIAEGLVSRNTSWARDVAKSGVNGLQSTTGTFGAMMLGGLGAGHTNIQERTAKAAEATAKNTKAMKRKMDNGPRFMR